MISMNIKACSYFISYRIINFAFLLAFNHLRRLNKLRSFVQMRNISLPVLLNIAHFSWLAGRVRCLRGDPEESLRQEFANRRSTQAFGNSSLVNYHWESYLHCHGLLPPRACSEGWPGSCTTRAYPLSEFPWRGGQTLLLSEWRLANRFDLLHRHPHRPHFDFSRDSLCHSVAWISSSRMPCSCHWRISLSQACYTCTSGAWLDRSRRMHPQKSSCSDESFGSNIVNSGGWSGRGQAVRRGNFALAACSSHLQRGCTILPLWSGHP